MKEQKLVNFGSGAFRMELFAQCVPKMHPKAPRSGFRRLLNPPGTDLGRLLGTLGRLPASLGRLFGASGAALERS